MSSATDEVSLSEDLLPEILTRLPLKSFSRSKCVSKSWYSLLSDNYVRNKLPSIVSGIFRRPDSSLHFLKNESDTGFHAADLDFFPFQHSSVLIDCCSGLLLFYSLPAAAFYVCNPTVKKYVSLPKPSRTTQLSILAFDPRHSRHFKVVSFISWSTYSAEVELFDSKSGNWILHKVHWDVETDSISSTMHYVDGVLLIMAHPNRIVAFDLDTITCSLIELPDSIKNGFCCLGKFGGRLRYCTNRGNCLRVWDLEDEEAGGWMLKHCVSVNGLGGFRVSAIHSDREVVYLGMKGKVVAYDVWEKKVEEVWELEEKGDLMQVWVYPFTRYLEDCLACLDW